MQFYILAELCDQHYRELCNELPKPPKTETEPIVKHGFCFHYQDPLRVCPAASRHFVYLTLEPTVLRRQASAKGGTATTEAKREAARANGSKGGRPPKNPNLFKTANNLLIEKINDRRYRVVSQDGSVAANNSDGSDGVFSSFAEADAHAKTWRPSFVDCPCGTKNMRTNQTELKCRGCKALLRFP